MKKYLKNYMISFLFLTICLVILGIVLVVVRFNSDTTLKTINTIGLIISSILFLLSAVLNGKLNKKRGIINGIIMTSIYLTIILILKIFNIDLTISSIIIKSLLLFIGNIIGVNI